MTLIHINHTNINNAFFINAIFSSILFGTLFVLDDIITNNLDKRNIKGRKKQFLKFLIHFIFISIITFFLTYVFKFVFGWGSIFLGKEI